MKRFILILLTCAMLVGCITCFAACNKEPVEISVEENYWDIINVLCTHIRNVRAMPSINYGDLSRSRSIDSVRDGKAQALHVAVDPNKYYYICGYYNSDHYNEETILCCGAKYTWVKFNKKDEITEYYGEKKLIAAVQVNKARFIRDITSILARTPKYEHFLIYTPEFQDGVNVADAIYCDISYIDFCSKDEKYVLYSSEIKLHEKYTMPCVKYKGKYYIEENSNKGYLESTYRDYYDDIKEIINSDEYEKKGYGIISIREFVNKILK